VELDALQRRWEALAKRDPLGAIYDPLARGEARDVERFLAYGEREISAVLDESAAFGVPRQHRCALDFGCGAGRLTQAMAQHFERCDGIDISPRMVALAERLNRCGERCRFRVNDTDSLGLFDDGIFDFVYSSLVLQHMDQAYARGYLREFVRVLRPGGLLVFQVPSERDTASELPWSAFRAEIEPPSAPLRLEPSEARSIRVVVRNRGDCTWRARLPRRAVRLGNHWLDQATVVVQDDGRADLPHDVAPGGRAEFELSVEAPALQGEYVLELDLVQEGIAWFAERGSHPGRVLVSVGAGNEFSVPARSTAAPATPGSTTPASRVGGAVEVRPLGGRLRALRGRIVRRVQHRLSTPVEMNAVPRAEVLAILDEAGARVLDVVENDAAGPGWVSLRYTATRASTGVSGGL